MKIYIDYVFFINFLFDFILLLGISIILKRNVSIKRLIIGSLFGSVSILILFINLNNILFFIIKMLFGLFMIIISFKYKDFKYTLNNFVYLIILSIILGGFLYFINLEAGYEHTGMIFYTNGKNINVYILIILSILFIIIYKKIISKYNREINSYFKVDLFLNKKIVSLNGFLDTGNKLKDPYFNKPVLILNNNIKINENKFIFVPFNSLNNKGILKCYFIDKIFIHNIGYKYNILVGISNDKISIPGVDIILNNEIMEE